MDGWVASAPAERRDEVRFLVWFVAWAMLALQLEIGLIVWLLIQIVPH